MILPLAMRRVVVALVPVVSIALLGGCGGSGDVSVLPDQGKAILVKPPGEAKKQKGMDRLGS